MAIPPITELPDPPSRGSAPATFVADADAFFDALPTFVTELNAAGDAIDTAVTDAEEAADTAIAAATATTVGTSTTSVAIGTGSKAFTTQAGKNWIVGTYLIIASAANPANFMTGQVTAYSGTSLTVNVTAIGGTGTLADWSIGLAGALGAQGAPGVDGNGAWTQIGSTVNTTSGTSATFSSIPGTFSDLAFEFAGVSTSTTATIQIEFSDNGSNWTSPVPLATGAAAANTYYGGIFIPRYVGPHFNVDVAVDNLAANRTAVNITGTTPGIAVRLGAPLTHVRFSVSTGNFDAGTIRLFGRQQV